MLSKKIDTKQLLFVIALLAVTAAIPKTCSTAQAESIDREVTCLATAIYHEARGEQDQGQLAVAQVVKNRTLSKHFPGTYCDVVYQRKQFSRIRNCRPDYNSNAWRKASNLAYMMIYKQVFDVTSGALWYYSHTRIKTPYWGYNKKITARIGNHTFLKDSHVK